MNEFSQTSRGFSFGDFKDRNGISCSIQESSLATEAAIWLGCNDAYPQQLIPGKGWTPIEMPEKYVANTRMHLTQDQVKDLLPVLQHFVATGHLPDETPVETKSLTKAQEQFIKRKPSGDDLRLRQSIKVWFIDGSTVHLKNAFLERWDNYIFVYSEHHINRVYGSEEIENYLEISST